MLIAIANFAKCNRPLRFWAAQHPISTRKQLSIGHLEVQLNTSYRNIVTMTERKEKLYSQT